MSQQIKLRNAETKRAYRTEAGYVISIIKRITSSTEHSMIANPDPASIISVKVRRLTDQVDLEVSPDTLVTPMTGEQLQAALDEYAATHPLIEGEVVMTTTNGAAASKKHKPATSKKKAAGALEEPAVTKKPVTYPADAPEVETPEAVKKEKKEAKAAKGKLSDVINPMLQAKKHTAGEIADAVIAKFPEYEFPKNVKDPKHYLISVIKTVRLKYAQDKFGADNVGLKEDPSEGKKEKPEKKAEKKTEKKAEKKAK